MAKLTKSEPYTMENLEKVLKGLKSGKSRDPNGFVNELFQNKNMSSTSDLRNSLLLLVNRIKETIEFPEFLKVGKIFSIYKGKGERALLENDRGIFILARC